MFCLYLFTIYHFYFWFFENEDMIINFIFPGLKVPIPLHEDINDTCIIIEKEF